MSHYIWVSLSALLTHKLCQTFIQLDAFFAHTSSGAKNKGCCKNENEMINQWPFLFCIRLGNLGKTDTGKLFRNFKWLKNPEDGSDFDDFWTKRIISAQPNFYFRKNETNENISKFEKKMAIKWFFMTFFMKKVSLIII